MKETKQTGSDNTMKSKMSVRTSKYFQSFKYAFHVISHPFDGFWELAHEGKGDLAVANTFVFFFLLTRVLKLLFPDIPDHKATKNCCQEDRRTAF